MKFEKSNNKFIWTPQVLKERESVFSYHYITCGQFAKPLDHYVHIDEHILLDESIKDESSMDR
jgi:hypothetical protein